MKHIVGLLSLIGYAINTLFWFVPIFTFAFLKLIPIAPWQTLISHVIDSCATAWVTCNGLNQRATGNTRWDVAGTAALQLQDWYLVIANHSSWVDILVLQRVFNRKIPFLKFFLKKELIWVPFLGLAWWALDFPFMQRYRKSVIAKRPELKGKDLEATRKACDKFQFKPVSVMNFVEGTRFTDHKHARQRSPFQHLLKPKAGGIAFVLDAMQSHLHQIVDVTIHYPHGTPTFWQFICGEVDTVQVRVVCHAIAELRAQGVIAEDYFNNNHERVKFQNWLNHIWREKDRTIAELPRLPKG